MKRLRYFGTDGIRGQVDTKITAGLCYKIGKALALYIQQRNLSANVLIGKDTRTSGDMIVSSVCSGLQNYGVNVVVVGVVPTGCVSYLASKQDVAFGIMITASHNTPDMNGIKIINNLGYKIDIETELKIESLMASKQKPTLQKGEFVLSEELVQRYLKFLFKIAKPLNGVRIALDCANGSNYKIAPLVYRALGAEVVEINTSNCGNNINVNSGALHPDRLVSEVIEHKCHIGFAFDGDADRLVVVTKTGRLLTGDELLYLFAEYLLQNDELNSLTVVGTILTNLGCEESLAKLGIKLIRVDVGDKNVVEKLRINNFSLGGESSGHVCIHNYGTTCDALLNSLQLLNLIGQDFDSVDKKLLPYKTYDSQTKNIVVSNDFRQKYNYNDKFHLNLLKIIDEHKDVKIVVRPSGTESVLRILVEGKNVQKNEIAMKEVEQFILQSFSFEE